MWRRPTLAQSISYNKSNFNVVDATSKLPLPSLFSFVSFKLFAPLLVSRLTTVYFFAASFHLGTNNSAHVDRYLGHAIYGNRHDQPTDLSPLALTAVTHPALGKIDTKNYQVLSR